MSSDNVMIEREEEDDTMSLLDQTNSFVYINELKAITYFNNTNTALQQLNQIENFFYSLNIKHIKFIIFKIR